MTRQHQRHTLGAIYSPPAGRLTIDAVPGRVFHVMRTIVLIDGQNLYHLARLAWAPVPVDRSSPYSWPSYDVERLAALLVARLPQRELSEVRFYTGVPAPSRERAGCPASQGTATVCAQDRLDYLNSATRRGRCGSAVGMGFRGGTGYPLEAWRMGSRSGPTKRLRRCHVMKEDAGAS